MNPDLPPTNRAIGWYHFILWIMPTCIATTTVFGIVRLTDVLRIGGILPFVLWCFLNLASTIGIGIFESRIDRMRVRPAIGKEMPRPLGFVLLQCVIVPLLSFAVAFTICVVSFLP